MVLVFGATYCLQSITTYPSRQSVFAVHVFLNSLTNLLSAACCWVAVSCCLIDASDCASDVCVGSICQVATCGDGVMA